MIDGGAAIPVETDVGAGIGGGSTIPVEFVAAGVVTVDGAPPPEPIAVDPASVPQWRAAPLPCTVVPMGQGRQRLVPPMPCDTVPFGQLPVTVLLPVVLVAAGPVVPVPETVLPVPAVPALDLVPSVPGAAVRVAAVPVLDIDEDEALMPPLDEPPPLV